MRICEQLLLRAANSLEDLDISDPNLQWQELSLVNLVTQYQNQDFSVQNLRQAFTLLNSAHGFSTLPDEEPKSLFQNQRALIAHYCQGFELVPPSFVNPEQSDEFFQFVTTAINEHRQQITLLLIKDLKTDKTGVYPDLLLNIHEHLPKNLKEELEPAVVAACMFHCVMNNLQMVDIEYPKLRQLQLL